MNLGEYRIKKRGITVQSFEEYSLSEDGSRTVQIPRSLLEVISVEFCISHEEWLLLQKQPCFRDVVAFLLENEIAGKRPLLREVSNE